MLSAVETVEADLAEIAKRDPRLARSTYAAAALAMARELDNASNSATSKSMCEARMVAAMDRLLELAPAAERKDNVDELKQRREHRRRGAGTAD